jgi:hypothetical protein
VLAVLDRWEAWYVSYRKNVGWGVLEQDVEEKYG